MRKCLCFILCMVWLLAGCNSPAPDSGNPAPPESIVSSEPATDEPVKELLVSTDELRIERTGSQTTVYDLVAGEIYNFETKMIARRKTAPAPVSNVLRDTDTLQIKQLKDVLGILVKGTGEFYLV